MQNAHLRMGTLTFVKQTRDTVTDVTVHLNQLVAEQPERPGLAVAVHLVSVFGGDVEVGAVAAAAHEGLKFQIKAPGLVLLGTLGEDPVLYRSSLQVPGRKRPVRHLILVSKTLFETTFGANNGAFRIASAARVGAMVSRGARSAQNDRRACGRQLFPDRSKRHQATNAAHPEPRAAAQGYHDLAKGTPPRYRMRQRDRNDVGGALDQGRPRMI